MNPIKASCYSFCYKICFISDLMHGIDWSLLLPVKMSSKQMDEVMLCWTCKLTIITIIIQKGMLNVFFIIILLYNYCQLLSNNIIVFIIIYYYKVYSISIFLFPITHVLTDISLILKSSGELLILTSFSNFSSQQRGPMPRPLHQPPQL